MEGITACLNGSNFQGEPMLVSWIIAGALVILYLIWIGIFYYGWTKTPSRSYEGGRVKTPVSIILPVRNEEADLYVILNDLVDQDYPQGMLEVIVVDDHSSDLTQEIVKDFVKVYGNIIFIKLEEGRTGKKQAFLKGLSAASFSFIVTTDADCRLSARWVRSMVECLEETKADLIAGPVLIKAGVGFFNKFQRLEFLSLLGSTAGSLGTDNPVMCSAANLGFRKESFVKVRNHYNENVSSGDDVFMLQAMYKSGMRKMIFLKNRDATVITKPQNGLRAFISQRKRWASKSRHYKTRASVFTSFLVFFLNFYALLCLLFALFYWWFLLIAAFLVMSKSLVDFPFLYSVTGYFGERKLMRYFPAIQVIYFFYISFTAIAAFTRISQWKGRMVKS
jgi:cellulose synthase/poly-beta-1,6-N-acetylglucosamine synthase-like glycosyltransferase